MKIAVVGLGLIGASLAKAIRRRTGNTVYGIDIDPATCKKAKAEKFVDKIIEPDALYKADITFVCLYPQATVDFILKNIHAFRIGSIVTDTCGVKQFITDRLHEPLSREGIHFIGAHPMAGREVSGIDGAMENLFDGASFIVTPFDDTPHDQLRELCALAREIGFGRVVNTTPEHHDEVIAYTSQLAHLVSNAYGQSPSRKKHKGFSAGSYKDLTRVAKMNNTLWVELFMENRLPLIEELDEMIRHLTEYRDALADGDAQRLDAAITLSK